MSHVLPINSPANSKCCEAERSPEPSHTKEAKRMIDQIQMHEHRPMSLDTHQPSIPIASPQDYNHEIQNANAQDIIVKLVGTLQMVRDCSLEEKESYFQTITNEISKQDTDLTENRIEELRKQKHTTFWSFIRKAATCILSVTSIVLGSFLTASGLGAIGGACLIGSGALGIASIILEEAQANPILVGAISLAAAAFGISGLAFNYHQLAQEIPKLVATLASSLVNVAQGVTQAGVAFHERNMSLLDAKSTKSQQKMALAKSDLEDNLSEIESSMRSFQQAEELAAHIVKEHSKLSSSITQSYRG